MPDVLEAPQWQTVGMVIDQNQRDFLARQGSLAEDLIAWLKAIELFRETRDERMIFNDPTPGDLRQHKMWIASLIAEGERLFTEASEPGRFPAGAVKFKLEDVEATLELLYLWQREWHSERLSPERRRELMKAVFNVEEPAA